MYKYILLVFANLFILYGFMSIFSIIIPTGVIFLPLNKQTKQSNFSFFSFSAFFLYFFFSSSSFSLFCLSGLLTSSIGLFFVLSIVASSNLFYFMPYFFHLETIDTIKLWLFSSNLKWVCVLTGILTCLDRYGSMFLCANKYLLYASLTLTLLHTKPWMYESNHFYWCFFFFGRKLLLLLRWSYTHIRTGSQ